MGVKVKGYVLDVLIKLSLFEVVNVVDGMILEVGDICNYV